LKKTDLFRYNSEALNVSHLAALLPQACLAGKRDSSEQSESESLKGTLKCTDVRKFSTIENFLLMSYKLLLNLNIKQYDEQGALPHKLREDSRY